MLIYKPSWFADRKILVSTAPTCGLAKQGRLLPLIDRTTGKRVVVTDPETGELIDAVDDQLLSDMQALAEGETTPTLRFIETSEVTLRSAVPIYYDTLTVRAFAEAMQKSAFSGFTARSLGSLIQSGDISVRGGHGSPKHEQRVGQVPYIKVSDLRAGLVNINPTNRVPLNVAEKFWRRGSSGLQAYDLLCPERTSKNIGDFCILMPGQEQVLLTKEILILRPGPKAVFDPFYLLWAMTLKIVRNQWKRIVFMQTNREDIGERYLEVLIPVPANAEHALAVSQPFRNYYQKMAEAQRDLGSYLEKSQSHHFFVTGSGQIPDVDPENL